MCHSETDYWLEEQLELGATWTFRNSIFYYAQFEQLRCQETNYAYNFCRHAKHCDQSKNIVLLVMNTTSEEE